MARTKKAVIVGAHGVGAAGSKAIATIDQELDAEVAALRERINQPGGNVIKAAPQGVFIAPDGFELGNEIQFIVLDFVAVNRFYLSDYNKDDIVPPDCFAVGRVLKDMVPEPDSPAIQHTDCMTCPMGGTNAWGTGQGGRGKACKNRRLVAGLLIDPNDPSAVDDPSAPIYLLDLSPTNVKFFDGYVGNIQRTIGHPVKAIVTVTAKNVGTYAQVSWIDPVPNPNYAVHAARRGECEDLLFRKPDFSAAAAAPPHRKPARRGAPVRPAPRPAGNVRR